MIRKQDVMTMTRVAKVELRDLHIAAAIGTYGPGDVVPDAHILDLTLTIAPDLVQIDADDIALVFDYDPLIARIDQIVREQKYETQEYLMTRIVRTCADYPQIAALDICLRKKPVLAGTGSLGVRLTVGAEDLLDMRLTMLI
jgi:dihydroneopterin aldolase